MSKIIYPGSVVHMAQFAGSIENSTPGATWAIDTYRNDYGLIASINGVVGVDGRVKLPVSQLAAGSYTLEFTMGTGEFFSIPVQSIAEATFIWQADYAAPLTKKPNLREIKFGDGYAQTSPNGINHNPESWDLTFSNMTDIEAMQIVLFLDMMGGYKSFAWVTPSGRKLRFTCKVYGASPNAEDDNSVHATFEQTFL